MLQCGETRLVGDDFLEECECPELLAEECLARNSKQLDHEWIDINDRAALGIKEQNAVLGRLEKAPVDDSSDATIYSWRLVVRQYVRKEGEIICKIR